jgi:hypothetical protein
VRATTGSTRVVRSAGTIAAMNAISPKTTIASAATCVRQSARGGRSRVVVRAASSMLRGRLDSGQERVHLAQHVHLVGQEHIVGRSHNAQLTASAAAGRMRVVRQAGTLAAINATVVKTIGAPTRISGSCGSTPVNSPANV